MGYSFSGESPDWHTDYTSEKYRHLEQNYFQFVKELNAAVLERWGAIDNVVRTEVYGTYKASFLLKDAIAMFQDTATRLGVISYVVRFCAEERRLDAEFYHLVADDYSSLVDWAGLTRTIIQRQQFSFLCLMKNR